MKFDPSLSDQFYCGELTGNQQYLIENISSSYHVLIEKKTKLSLREKRPDILGQLFDKSLVNLDSILINPEHSELIR